MPSSYFFYLKPTWIVFLVKESKIWYCHPSKYNALLPFVILVPSYWGLQNFASIWMLLLPHFYLLLPIGSQWDHPETYKVLLHLDPAGYYICIWQMFLQDKGPALAAWWSQYLNSQPSDQSSNIVTIKAILKPTKVLQSFNPTDTIPRLAKFGLPERPIIFSSCLVIHKVVLLFRSSWGLQFSTSTSHCCHHEGYYSLPQEAYSYLLQLETYYYNPEAWRFCSHFRSYSLHYEAFRFLLQYGSHYSHPEGFYFTLDTVYSFLMLVQTYNPFKLGRGREEEEEEEAFPYFPYSTLESDFHQSSFLI